MKHFYDDDSLVICVFRQHANQEAIKCHRISEMNRNGTTDIESNKYNSQFISAILTIDCLANGFVDQFVAGDTRAFI